MKLGRALGWAALLGLLLAGAGQWWLVQRTQEEMARWIARLVPQGELRYERLWPFPWGAGRAWGLSFQPEGMLRLTLQTEPGFRIQARELRVDEFRRGASGTVERVRGTLRGVRVPVQERRGRLPDTSDLMRIPPPTLFDMGYSELELDLAFDLKYVAEAQLALLSVNVHGQDIGHAVFDAQLEGTPQTFDRAPDQILVRKLIVEFEDAGLIRRYKDVSAARARLGLAAWQSAMTEQLDRRAAKEKWKWDADTAQAVRSAIRQSDYIQATIDPPGDVILRNIRLYALADWPVLLGFRFSTAGTFDHPPPVKPSRFEALMDAVLRTQDGVGT